LTVLGFGFSAALIAPIADFLVKNYGGITNTFRIFGVAFLIILVFLSMLMMFPPDGWVPRGWTPPAPKAGAAPRADFMRNEMVKTSAFKGLWICYTIGTLAGLMAIGVSKPVGLEIAANSGMDTVAAGALMTGLVIPFAAANGFGRPIFGTLTDKLTPRNTAMLSYVLIIVASLAVYTNPSSVSVYTISFAILWGCLGGWLAIAPTATATYFGIKDNAKNYGLVFTAYGAGAVIGSLLAGKIKDMFGAYANVFPIVAGLALLGIIVAFLLMKQPTKTN
jgi:MFS family permease